MSPEGGVFDLMAGIYSKSGIPQFGVYLMAHSGDDLVTDRVSRKSVRVKRPALTCAYAIQPEVVKRLAGNASFRGRGLLARFLYAAPRSWIGERDTEPKPVSEATHEAYQRLVRRLAAANGEHVLRLADEASIALRASQAEIERILGDGGRMETMRDWGGKLAGETLRLAAVLHCIQHGAVSPIEAQTILAAIEIARCLVPHAETVLNMMQAQTGSRDEDANHVLRWIKRHGRREFTKSEAQRRGPGGIRQQEFPKPFPEFPQRGRRAGARRFREYQERLGAVGNRDPRPGDDMTGPASILADLLADCDARGVRLHPTGDGGLTFDASHDALTPAILARLKTHKAEPLALLRPTTNPTVAPRGGMMDAPASAAGPSSCSGPRCGGS